MTEPLTPEEIVRAIHDYVFLSAVRDSEVTISDPPGRNPSETALATRDWYAGLDEENRKHFRYALRMAADHAVFGFFCVLDNVRPVVAGFAQQFRLYIDIDGQRFEVPDDEDLHGIFRSIADEESS